MGPKNFKLVVDYDGSRFHGWQRQDSMRTVQGELERAIAKILHHEVAVSGASRTDAGVHARGQVCNFQTSKVIPEVKLRRAINSVTPNDIAIMAVDEVPSGFHARHDACWKRYRYGIWNLTRRPSKPTRCHVPRPLAIEAMREAAQSLLGEHDFAAFAHREALEGSTRRCLYEIQIKKVGPEIDIEVAGDAFLYNMVRIIAGTLIEVGRGQRSLASVEEALKSRDRRLAGVTAPAEALELLEISYVPWGLR